VPAGTARSDPANFRPGTAAKFQDLLRGQHAGYNLTLVLPDLRTEGEPDEKQLETVAGGTFDFFSLGTGCGMCHR